MMNVVPFLSSVLMATTLFAQRANDVAALAGLWIAKDYYDSFEVTNSALGSIDAFHPLDPVGLRINPAELKDGFLHVGYSTLHDHLIRPEVSGYCVVEKDTVYEQGSFEIDTRQDSAGYFRIKHADLFNADPVAYLHWNAEEGTITLSRPHCTLPSKERIEYVRITLDLSPAYPFPNPLYCYVRSRTLAGQYQLKDPAGTVLSESIEIGVDGAVTGYTAFNGLVFHYSTDIYCGGAPQDDLVLLCEDTRSYFPECSVFAYKRIDPRTIHLYNRVWDKSGSEEYELQLRYVLQRR